MNKAGKIILFATGLLGLVASFLFVVIEGRLLFSLDYSFYADVGAGFTGVFFRFLTALLSLALSVPFLLLLSKKERPNLNCFVYISSATLFAVCLIVSIFLDYNTGAKPLYLTIPLRVLSGLYLVGAGLLFLSSRKKED